MITQSVLSRAFVPAAITATAGGVPVNPTGDIVEFAFTATSTNPVSGDWHTGAWDGTSPRPPGNFYIAQCLVGPGGTVQLPVGKYQMWVRITDNPEVPVIPFGILRIT